MAIEYTVVCDDCGSIICASGRSARAARAEAQLQCGAVSAGGRDRCKSCRTARNSLPVGHAADGAHSAGPRAEDTKKPGGSEGTRRADSTR